MKKFVGLLAMLALVFVLAGCPDPVNTGTSDPGAGSEVPDGKTYEIVLDGTYTATVNTYGSDPNGETQVKIPTNISGLKVGDKVVVKMKGTTSYEVPVMEICLADTSEAAGYWKLLADGYNYTAENVNEFDINHTFVVTAAPVTGAEFVINGKGSRDTLTFDCTPKADEPEPTPDPDPEPEPEAPAVPAYVEYTTTFTRDATKEETALVLQLDNDGSQDADGLKVDIKGLKVKVTIGDAEPEVYDLGDVQLIPNQWGSPAYAKTDVRKVIGLKEDVAAGTVVKVQIVEGEVTPVEKASAIIFALQSDTAYDMLVADADQYKPAFAKAE